MPLPRFDVSPKLQSHDTYVSELRRLIDSSNPHGATNYYWNICRSNPSCQPTIQIFKLVCEGYGVYYTNLARSKADYWINGPTDPRKKPLYAPKPSTPSLQVDAKRIAQLMQDYRERNMKIDDHTLGWLLISACVTFPVATLEQTFTELLQSVLSLPGDQRLSILDSTIYVLLDRDLGSLINIVLESTNLQISPLASAAIISWNADQDDISNALLLLDRFSQKYSSFEGTPVMYDFLLRYCQRQKDIKTAENVWKRLKKTKIPISLALYNSYIKVFMNAGTVERALDAYDEMIAAGFRADTTTNQILGQVWRR